MSDGEGKSTKVIATLGNVLFWLIWVYGLICIGVLTKYREALNQAYNTVFG